MRTHILIAALALSATAAHAAPRSLSGPQSNPVQTAPVAQASETPVFKVQSTEDVKPDQQQQAAPQPALTPDQAAPVSAQTAPPATQAGPADADGTRSDETRPAETNVAPISSKPVRHAQRKPRRQQMTVEQRVERDLRSIERTLGAIGAASAISAISYAIPLVIYW